MQSAARRSDRACFRVGVGGDRSFSPPPAGEVASAEARAGRGGISSSAQNRGGPPHPTRKRGEVTKAVLSQSAHRRPRPRAAGRSDALSRPATARGSAPCSAGARGGSAADRGQRRALSSSRPPSARRRAHLHPRKGDHRPRRPQARPNAERHLKPPEEMARLFRDAPEAIEETLRSERSAHLLARRIALRISRRDHRRLRQRAGRARASHL